MKQAFLQRTSVLKGFASLCITSIVTVLTLTMPAHTQEIIRDTAIADIRIWASEDGATATLDETTNLLTQAAKVTEDTYIAVGENIWIEIVFESPGIVAASETPPDENTDAEIDTAAAALELRLDRGGPDDPARGRDYLKPAMPYPGKQQSDGTLPYLTYRSVFYRYTVQPGDQDFDGGWFDETPFRGGKLYTQDSQDDPDTEEISEGDAGTEPDVLVDFDAGQQLIPFTANIVYPKIGTEITDIKIYTEDVEVDANGQREMNSGTEIVNEDTTVRAGEHIWIEIEFSPPIKSANAFIRAAFDQGGPNNDDADKGRGYLGNLEDVHDYSRETTGGYPTLLYKYTVQLGDFDSDGGWMDETPFEWGWMRYGGVPDTADRTEFARHGEGLLLPPYTKRIYYPKVEGTVEFDGTIDLGGSMQKDAFLVVHPFSLDTGGLDIHSSQSWETEGDWQDLEAFFRNSGTIELLAPKDLGIEERAVVISEIMWGLDAAATPETASQWIELYNMGFNETRNPLFLNRWKLQFVEGEFEVRSEDGNYDVIDQVSNAGFGWNSFVGNVPGQNGRSRRGPGNNQDVKSIISMYREIDYVTARQSGADKFTAAKDGTNGANWSASAPPSANLADPRVGTPGAEPSAQPVFEATPVPRTPVIFNEIGNASGSDGDWIELRNVTNREVNVGNWEISLLNANTRDERLVVIPEGEDFVLPANGVLLIVATQPKDTVLARGTEFGVDARDIEERGGLSHLYHVADSSGDDLALPDSGAYLLILRSEKDKRETHEAIIDVAGNYFEDKNDGTYRTKVWPLHGTLAPRTGDREEDLDGGTVWRRSNPNRVGYHKDAWVEAVYTGLGYDRAASESRANGGTPGYPNDAIKNRTTEFANDVYVTISEIMFVSDNGRLPQWIELYNSSETQAVDLEDWRLEIENYESEDLGRRVNATLILGKKTLYPNQTLLIASRRREVSDNEHFPDARVYNLWTTPAHRRALDMTTPRDSVLSEVGFALRLSDSKQVLIDVVGNLDGNRRTRDEPAWALPSGWNKDEERMSMIRRYVQGTRVALDGTEPDGWIPAGFTKFNYVPLPYFYGHEDDWATPLFRSGGPLPVELEHFGVSGYTPAGVVITWATASEIDNAGFNVLRREGREGIFRVVTPALIAGAGTTGERNTYTFTDTTAKSGVLYFYQIEDVSFDGMRQVLATRRMKGHVTPAHRMLTTFGELKKRR